MPTWKRQLAFGGLLLVWMAPADARAVEVKPQTVTTVTWTDNLFSAPRDQESELSIREAPGFTISDEGGRYKWQLRYLPSYEFFTRNNDLSGFDHEADGSFKLHLTRRTTLSGTDSFKRFRAISRFNQTVDIGGGVGTVPVVVQDRNRFIRNIASVSLEHMIDRRNQLWASYDNALLDFAKDRITDRYNQGVSAGYNYVLDAQTRIGVLGSWRNQLIENKLSKTRREADFYNVSASIAHAFDPTLRVNLSAGPTLVEGRPEDPPVSLVSMRRYPITRSGSGYAYIDASTCPLLPDGRPYYDPLQSSCAAYNDPFYGGVPQISGNVLANESVFNPPTQVPFQGALASSSSRSNLTFFVSSGLTKEWGRWKLRLLAERRDDTSNSTGAASISNTGNFRLEWTPRPQWLFIWSGTYVRRDADLESNIFRFALAPTTGPGDAPCLSQVFGVCLAQTIGAAQVVSAGALDLSRKDVIDTYRTFFRTEYRMTRRLTLQGTVLYMDEKETLEDVTLRDFNRLTVWFSLKYEFDAFHI